LRTLLPRRRVAPRRRHAAGTTAHNAARRTRDGRADVRLGAALCHRRARYRRITLPTTFTACLPAALHLPSLATAATTNSTCRTILRPPLQPLSASKHTIRYYILSVHICSIHFLQHSGHCLDAFCRRAGRTLGCWLYVLRTRERNAVTVGKDAVGTTAFCCAVCGVRLGAGGEPPGARGMACSAFERRGHRARELFNVCLRLWCVKACRDGVAYWYCCRISVPGCAWTYLSSFFSGFIVPAGTLCWLHTGSSLDALGCFCASVWR